MPSSAPHRMSFPSKPDAAATQSTTTFTAPVSRSSLTGRSSFAVPRLKPLTRLEPDPGPSSLNEATKLLGNLSVNKSSTPVNQFPHQSDHSRRGSSTANTLISSSRPYLSPTFGLSTSKTSLPNLTLGSRIRDLNSDPASSTSPHPYDVILPGQEKPRTAYASPKSRAMSYVSHSTVGSHGSSSATNQARTVSIGARRFTQIAASSVGSTISSTGTANQAAAVHARRFSTIAREPSSAVLARHNSQGSNRPWNVILDAAHDDDQQQSQAKESAKSDARILVNSLSSLLGHDGGGEAVGKFVKYILANGLVHVKNDLLALIEKVLQSAPSLQAAYLTVHLHEILEHIQRLGALILAEPEISALFSDITGTLSAFMTSSPSQSGSTSYTTILHNMMEKLTSNSVYKSAFLTLIDRVCQFILVSEGVRDGLWSRLSESLFGPPDATGQHQVRHIAECISLLFASVEQLTGSPIKPLVKSFIGWIAVLDDLLTKVATDTRELLARTSSIPVNDYVAHPMGYIYSPSETNAKLEAVLQIWANNLFDTSIHKEVYGRFKRNLDNVILGVQGNSTFARFSRDLRRVWNGILGYPDSGVAGTGLQGALECFRTAISEFLLIPLANVESHDEMMDLKLSDINLSVLETLLSEFSINAHSTFYPCDGTFRSNTSFHLKEIQLMTKAVSFTCSRTSEPKEHVAGTLDAKFTLDVTIRLGPKDQKLLHMFFYLPTYEGTQVVVSSADVKFYPANNSNSSTVWPVLEKHLISRVQNSVSNWIDDFFSAWLPVKPFLAKPVPSKVSATEVPPLALSQKLPVHPSHVHETHGSARDRFKASIRNMTGLRAGSVLPHLQNPLSDPGSPAMSPALDGQSVAVQRKRGQSMADHLTDISKADSTLPENIHRPPFAGSRQVIEHILPNVFDDDEDELPSEYETMARSLSICAERDTTSISAILRPVVSEKANLISVFSHRGGMPLFPSAEIPYEAYQIAEASMGEPQTIMARSLGHQEIPSMAQSLSELTSRDTTTREAIEHPPIAYNASEVQQNFLETSKNMSMDKVTRHLSGLPDREAEFTATISGSGHDGLIRSGNQHQELAHKVVMADLLTDKLTVDNTLPENQATGDLAGPVAAQGVPTRPGLMRLSTKEVVPMAKTLNKDAAVDTTLLENIVCPPGHHPQVRHPSSVTGSGASFSGLKNLQPMSTALDESIEMDFTTPEGQLKMHRLYEKVGNNAAGERGQTYESGGGASAVVGLTDQELKQRRQSFKLTDEAMRDTTLLESIRNPPVVASFPLSSSPLSAVDLENGESELQILNRERERKKSVNAGLSI